MFYIVSRDDCPWCDKAIDLLKSKGEDLRVFSVLEHPMIIRLMVTSGMRTVPQVWRENKHIGGYTELKQLFEESET